jgi:hypothetical protein
VRIKKLAGPVPQKGQTITALEGVDLEGNDAVVLSAKPLAGESQRLVTLFFPALGTIKEVRVPLASTVTLKEETGYDIPESQVDELRLTSPDRSQLPIRNNIPDSFYPTDPNYPSTMTDVLWRPTVRWTPYPRYYSYQGKKKTAVWPSLPKLMRVLERDDIDLDTVNRSDLFHAVEKYYQRYWGKDPDPSVIYHVTNQILDVAGENVMANTRKYKRSRSRGHRFSERRSYYPYGPATPDTDTDRPRRYNIPTRRSIDGQPSIPPPDPRVFDPDLVTPELVKSAVAFWQGYQDKRHKKLSGVPGLGRAGMPLEKWAVIYQKENGYSTPTMDKLWHYLMGIDWVNASVYRNWKDLLEANELNQVRTPRYYTEDEPREASMKRLHPRLNKRTAKLRRLAKAAGLTPEDFLNFFINNLQDVNIRVQDIDDLMGELVTSDEAVANGKLMQRYLVDLRERFDDLKNHVLGLLSHFEGGSEPEPEIEP